MDIEKIAVDYDRDGYVRLRGFVSADRIARIKTRIEKYHRDILPKLPPDDYVLESDGKSVRNLWRMDLYDDYFLNMSREAFMIELVSTLIHGEATLMHAETFNKPAGVGSAVPCHQDNGYFNLAPPDVLTVWIALDAATVENGAMYYLPGSHHKLLPHKASGVKGNSLGLIDPPDPDPSREFCGTLEPGDALIHHCQLIHRSEPNRSNRPRAALLFVYQGAHTRVDEEGKRRYRKALAAVLKK